MPRKDRVRYLPLGADVEMIVARSSAHPVEYAITLRVQRGGIWRTVRSYDNAHRHDEHHEHRYTGDRKHEPVVSYGSVNEAMCAAELKIMNAWADMVRSLETRQ